MGNAINKKEGFININGLNLFYREFFQDSFKSTMLCLHGGPGMSHDYLMPLSDLANYGIKVILYDQFGCGKSDAPGDKSKFTIDYAVEEVEGVRKKLCPEDKIFLMGSSYGGALALAYALKYQKNLRGLVISGGLASTSLAVKEMNRLIENLPAWAGSAIKKYGESGEYSNPEYIKASAEFFSRYFIRVDPVPQEVVTSLEYAEKRDTYRIMNGPNEFTITGTIKGWDITEKLHEIKIPTLITVGEYDEVTEVVAEEIHKRVDGSILKVLPNCSHLSMWDNRDGYNNILMKFIDSID